MISIDEDDLAEVRRLNRKLARSPRFHISNRLGAWFIQSLLRLSQIGGNAALKRAGLTVETRVVTVDGASASVRILRGQGPVNGIVLDIHGGGWAIGNARMDDVLNTALIKACNVAVVSVDYRLAGATPLQGLFDDCLAAARWVLSDGLPEYQGLPVIILGESAGGHLAAATLLALKRWPDLLRRIAGAVLYYGVYDLAGTGSVRRAGPDVLVLDGPNMLKGLRKLTPGMTDAERRERSLSPLYGDLTGLPPAFMVVGEIDPLLDDTVEMAERWRAVNEVELHLLPEAPHGFIHFKTSMAAKVLARSHAWIGSQLDRAR
ncbi:MAG: esterase [Rubritepida sp.]|nr:esterase [Rubritepida sp.]